MSVIHPEPKSEDVDITPTFVALCPDCNGLLGASVDNPDHHKETAKDVSGWIRAGLTLEKWPVNKVRVAGFCKCPSRRKGKRAA